MNRHHIALFVALLLCGCANAGTAPQIDALSLDADQISVGEATQLLASLEFRDPDGDVLEAIVSIGSELGPSTSSTVAVTGARGLLGGTVSVQLAVQPPAPGSYTVTVRLRDAEGNDSNQLTTTLEAL